MLKHPSRSKKFYRLSALATGVVTSLVLLIAAPGCGKSLSAASTSSQDSIPVNGVGGFGSQCPFGEIGDPTPVQLQALNCPISDTSLQLDKPLMPLVLEADCDKYEVNVRSLVDTRIEATWKALPDGRFYFTMDAGVATFKDDGAGHSDCQTPVEVSVQGLMKCRDRDHVHLEVDATWFPGQSMGTEEHLTGPRCSFPSSCVLHGFTALNQCGG